MAKRYKHSLSNYRLLTGDMGWLYPCQLQEVLPGDSVRAHSTALIRFSPLLAPVMHPVTVRIHHWFVPNRLVWSGWEDFITGGERGADNQTVPQVPHIPGTENVFDYLGIAGAGGEFVNAMPIRAYNMIYNEFYRDQDIVNVLPESNILIQNCAWEKDYLTTSRPTPQKGPDITIPLAQDAPVYAVGAGTGSKETYYVDNDDSILTGPAGVPFTTDLTGATATNVNDWRRAFALQRYQEARNRFGGRFAEYLAYLGVNAPDSRLQRPEYLGGGKTTVNFSEVLQTAEGASTPVGEMKGHGIAAVRTRPFTRHFNEHGYFMSIISVRPKTVYMDNIPRTFLRREKEDYWQKELEQIGMQTVYQGEVQADSATLYDTFGYQDRYSEYKRTLSQVCGEFRNILDHWHLGRELEETATLNGHFIKCLASKRIFAEQNQHSLWMMVQNNVKARRLVRRNASNRII